MAKKIKRRGSGKPAKAGATKKARGGVKPRISAAEREDEAFARAKEEALERVLGPMDRTVLHAVIPFAIGGGLDLYSFSKCLPGKVIATQELISRQRKDRAKKSSIGYYELVACLPARKGSDEECIELVSSILNPIAMYAFEAVLESGETAEVPMEKGTQGVVLVEYPSEGKFKVKGEMFGLMTVVPVLASELKFARKHGVGALMQKMLDADVWPYADVKRKAVV
jgi:hypothetical protein